MRGAIARLSVFLVAVGVCAAMACSNGRVPGDLASTGAPPPMFTPVGPVPGPQADSPRRANPYRANRSAMAEGRQLFV